MKRQHLYVLVYPLVHFIISSFSSSAILRSDPQTPRELAIEFINSIRNNDLAKYRALYLNDNESLWLINNEVTREDRRKKELRIFEETKVNTQREIERDTKDQLFNLRNITLEYLKLHSWDSCQVIYYPDSVYFDKYHNVYATDVALTVRHGNDTVGINTGLLLKLPTGWKMAIFPRFTGHTGPK